MELEVLEGDHGLEMAVESGAGLAFFLVIGRREEGELAATAPAHRERMAEEVGRVGNLDARQRGEVDAAQIFGELDACGQLDRRCGAVRRLADLDGDRPELAFRCEDDLAAFLSRDDAGRVLGISVAIGRDLAVVER